MRFYTRNRNLFDGFNKSQNQVIKRMRFFLNILYSATKILHQIKIIISIFRLDTITFITRLIWKVFKF